MFVASILVKALQKLLGCNKEDRFSELPDALLLNILERLGTFDAVRACVLSNHLLKLPAMLSRISIDFFYISGEYVDPNSLEFDDMVRANRAVADLTDKILTTGPPQLTIRELNLTFVLRLDDCLSIGRSVARAMGTRKLNTVQFKILTEKHGLVCEDCTPADLLSFGKQLNAFLAACPDAFAGLAILELQSLRFGESDLPNILATCKRLEYLILEHCDAGIGSTLKFEHDQLVELKIMTLRLSKLLANVPNICDLHLDFESEKVPYRAHSKKKYVKWKSPDSDFKHDNLAKLTIFGFQPDSNFMGYVTCVVEAAPRIMEVSLHDRKRVPHEESRLCGAENTREKRALRRAGIRRGNSLPEGEIDAIAIVIELDIISIIIIIIISTIYAAITSSPL
ncbi:hypothetical protein QYE76_069059 [Lolium multiflorum]|uniref:F-box domain-containing protein n=1 Tax=Lolium multiflorum TaxID=4521 RepID=A0AAD8SG16_LOLMU|nr:hypothetical protein QYE76_069059 [Lolium multiflorum]